MIKLEVALEMLLALLESFSPRTQAILLWVFLSPD